MRNLNEPPLSYRSLEAKSQKKLLSITYARLVFGIRSIPFVGAAFVAWSISNNSQTPTLWSWLSLYVLAAFFISIQNKHFKREMSESNNEIFVKKWYPKVHRIAFIHGIALSLIVIITSGKNSFEYSLLLHISLAAIIAANASHQTPVLTSFLCFFLTSWGITLIYIPWTYPEHWQFILPLSIIYLFAIFRHAREVHYFFLNQVKLEEDSAKIAEKYLAEKTKAENALQAKNQFLETASHDLRQPVQAMSFLIESIARRNTNNELIPSLNDLRTSIRSVHLMFNSLLDLSKIESGSIKVKKNTVDINQLLLDITALFSEEAKNSGLRLRTYVPKNASAPKNATLITDPALLRQCLLNLVHNALRYTLKGGVLISARPRGDNWLFEVWDTGIGIAGEEQQDIYSPHYRSEHAWRLDNAGHGLGLAVVARCADLLGATYGVQSQLGKGSRFWLMIPKTDSTNETETLSLSQVSDVSILPKLSGTCLMVDDDPMVTRAFLDLMQAWGMDAQVADSGRTALSLLADGFQPQMIFCDQRLRSGESGFDLLKDLLSKLPDAQGAMISGEYDSPELQQAEEEGYMVLTKPLEVAQLHAVLTATCGPRAPEAKVLPLPT